MKKVQEGNLVSVPLADGRFSVGVIARVEKIRPRKPYGIFIYFLRPFARAESVLSDESYLNIENSVLRLKTSALDIYSGLWKTIGRIGPWNRDTWPLPDLFHNSLGSNIFYRIKLDERDLITQINKIRMIDRGGPDLNDLYGSLAAQEEVSKQMSNLKMVDA